MKRCGVAGRRPLHCVKGFCLRAFRLQCLWCSKKINLFMAASGGPT